MGRKASDDHDYIVVKGKVSNRDKDGNDISADALGPGGRHKENGSFSALAYDLEVFEDSDDTELDDLDKRLLKYAVEEQRLKAQRQANIEAGVDFLFAFIEAATEYLESHPEVTIKIVDGVASFGKNVAGCFKVLKAKLTPKKVLNVRKKKETTSVEAVTAPIMVDAEQKKQSAMTIEYARAEVLQILAHYIEIKKGLQRLSGCDYIELQKLGFDGVITRLEGIVQQYPALMDASIEASILQLSFNDLEYARIKKTLYPCK